MKRPIDRLKEFEKSEIEAQLSKIDKKSTKIEDLQDRIWLLERYNKIKS